MNVYVDRVAATGQWVVDVPSLHRYGVAVPAIYADPTDAAVAALFAIGEPTDHEDVVIMEEPELWPDRG